MMGLIGKHKLYAKYEIASFSRCKYIIGEPKILGASQAQDYANFLLCVRFMMGIGKPGLHAKFEVVSFSRCGNIIGKPQNFGELL